MKKLLLSLAVVLFVAACQFWDSPAYTDDGGVNHPAKKGVVTVLSEGARAAGGAGVPYAGAVGGLLAILGGLGTYLVDKRHKKNLRSMVKLLNDLKPELAAITNDQDLDTLILKYASPKTKFGRALEKAWAQVKESKVY